MTRRQWVRVYVLFWVMINVVRMLQTRIQGRVCFFWITWLIVTNFNQASQIAVATLGLTYNINSADKIAVTAPGTVSVPDMTNIQTGKVLSTNSQAISALRYTANK